MSFRLTVYTRTTVFAVPQIRYVYAARRHGKHTIIQTTFLSIGYTIVVKFLALVDTILRSGIITNVTKKGLIPVFVFVRT